MKTWRRANSGAQLSWRRGAKLAPRQKVGAYVGKNLAPTLSLKNLSLCRPVFCLTLNFFPFLQDETDLDNRLESI
jgi:hypothetical protein